VVAGGHGEDAIDFVNLPCYRLVST